MDTDDQLYRDIIAEFKRVPILHYTQLHLHVHEGVVTVSGRVNSLAQRKAAERAAQRITSIKILIVEIQAAAIPITLTNIPADAQ